MQANKSETVVKHPACRKLLPALVRSAHTHDTSISEAQLIVEFAFCLSLHDKITVAQGACSPTQRPPFQCKSTDFALQRATAI
jgi:hypothetical protein